MGIIGFAIFYGLNWIITLLPFRILYVISDFLFLVLYYFPSYRREVVRENLRNSFPEKSGDELALIEKKFYKHLADLFIETLKLTHLSNRQLMKRFTVTNPGLLDKLYESGRDIAVVHSHYNNWEWLCILPLYTKHLNVPVYKPVRNRHFDWFLNKLRTRNDAVLTPMNNVIREIYDKRKKNIRALYAFVSDQTPAKPDIRYWTTFLNQETPVYLGVEKIAAKFDMAVVFFNVSKVKRGYYSLTAELLFNHTGNLPDYLVTNTHVKRLEEIIREKPEYWVWSHRRWKHKKPQGDA